MSGHDRHKLMHKFADLLEADVDNLAMLEALDNGKPFVTA
jgi:acyl-CoA reductase-like NAD-dependent aldehyde dehydrogenase